MAGIEKICELTGEYYSYDMYAMKRNQLQVGREHRKKFRGAEHILEIRFEELMFEYSFGGKGSYDPNDPHDVEHFSWHKGRVVKEYRFTLKVSDPALQGEVEGEYMNWTTHLPTVKRKLKRLLRCRKLNIVKV